VVAAAAAAVTVVAFSVVSSYVANTTSDFSLYLSFSCSLSSLLLLLLRVHQYDR
jgi:hypothetical protein